MQTRFRLSLVALLAAIVVLSSCSKSNKEGRYIPKNAAMAVLIDAEAIAAKLPWEEVKQNELFKTLYADSSLEAYIKSALDNPENTGIDMKKNLMFFIQKDTIGGYIAFEGAVKDIAKFKQFNTSATKATETEKSGVHYLVGNKITATWDKEKFVVIVDAPQMNDANKFTNAFDSSFTPAPSIKRDAVAAATAIYELKEDGSLGKDEKFSSLVKEKGDIHFWMNIAAFNTGSANIPALSMLNISKLYEGSFVTGVTNFDNGKINVDIRSYSGKEMSEINKKYDSDINKDMIKRIPAKDLAVIAALSFKPEGLREFIKLTGMEGLINMGAATIGFTFDDFIKANKGDILFALSDLKKDTAGSMHVNALFAASIGDKNAFGKLIESGNKLLNKEKTGGGVPPLFYNKNDNYFALGTEKESVDKYLNTANNNSYDFLDKLTGGSAFYVNFQVLMSAMNNDLTKDSLDNIAYQATIKMWENVIAGGTGFKDGAATQHIEINLVDKNTNSLKQLNKYIGTLGSIQQQKKIKRDKWMNEAVTENLDEEQIPTISTQ